MPKTLVTINEILQLFDEVKNRTVNFTKIEPDLLVDKPKSLLVLRLALGMSQNQFEKLMGNNSKNSSKYELGKIRKMRYSTAEKLSAKLESVVRPVTVDQIIERFEKSKAESNGWFRANKDTGIALKARRSGAIASLRNRRTLQESKLETALLKSGYKFHINYPLREDIIVDAYLPEKNLVIECKDIRSESRGELKEQIGKLALQGFKIKFSYKRLTLWGLIEANQSLKENDMQELEAFDEVFSDLGGLIRRLSS